MDKTAYRDEIKLKLTGDMLELELDDSTIDKLLNSALREILRYICSTKIITIPYKQCIDLSNIKDTNNELIKVSSVSRIFRSQGYMVDGEVGYNVTDPMYALLWLMLGGLGNLTNFQDYAYNWMSWNTMLQIRNTLSTDLSFRYDKMSNKLYINVASNKPEKITIEYVPRFDNVEEITSDYWIDMLIRLAVAITKLTVGRIRTRFTLSNALWSQDGQALLDEGTSELNDLREQMKRDTLLVYGID